MIQACWFILCLFYAGIANRPAHVLKTAYRAAPRQCEPSRLPGSRHLQEAIKHDGSGVPVLPRGRWRYTEVPDHARDAGANPGHRTPLAEALRELAEHIHSGKADAGLKDAIASTAKITGRGK